MTSDAEAFLDRFRLVALDMHGTFMFGHDRFGPEQDFAATWARLTDLELPPETVRRALRALLAEADRRYREPTWRDDFPSMGELLAELPESRGLDLPCRTALAEVLAAHEIGAVPPDHAAALGRLAARHRLGLVSNLFSAPAPWRAQLTGLGLSNLFEATVFSSETRSVKPSPRLFERLLAATGIWPDEAVFVGDDPLRDVAGARAAGLATVWLRHGEPWPEGLPPADLEVETLLDLTPPA